MIICCGEALIDMLPRKVAGEKEMYLPVPGGAVFNTAIALGRLGKEVGFYSGISTDMFGQLLISHLEASGVSTAYCRRSSNPTTFAFVTLKKGIAQYSFFDENTAGRMLGPETLPDLPESVQALHFGAISLIPEPCGSTFEELMLRAHKKFVISLDPNIRPGFIVNEPVYRQRLRRMIGMSDVIKVSEEDLSWIEPGASFEQTAQNWIEDGCSVVTLTRGEEGVRTITRSIDISVPATPVKVVDTVGAGDTFNAGFLASLSETKVLSKEAIKSLDEETLRRALQHGTDIAAHTVSKAGANPPWRDELKTYLG